MRPTYQLLILALLGCLLHTATSLWAQDSLGRDGFTPYRELGLNFSPLLTTLIPFNNTNSKNVGPYVLAIKRYRKPDRAFRFGLGIDLPFQLENDSDVNWIFNMRFGTEKKRIIYKKFFILSGFDFLILTGNRENSFPLTGDNGQGFIGIGGSGMWGIGYQINEKMAISTESSLFFGLVGDSDRPGLSIQFIPPLGLFLNMRLPKKEKYRAQ